MFIALTVFAAVCAPANAHQANAVTTWNANAGEAAIVAVPRSHQQPASRIAYVRDDAPGHPRRPQCDRAPLASVRIRRAQRQAKGVSRGRRGRGRTRRAGRRCSTNSRNRFPDACAPRRSPSVEADYAAALARHSGRSGEDARDRTRAGRRRGHPRPARRGRRGHHRWSTTDYPQGTSSRRVPLHTRLPTSRSPRAGAEVTPFVLARQLAVPPGSALRGDPQEVHRRLRRGQASRRRRRHHAQRAHRRADRDRPLLGRELPAAVEPDRAEPSPPTHGLDLWEQARLFGLLNMALADGYIGSFETKYYYNYWRPVTAIQTADTDGNPNTERRPDLDAAGADASDPGLRLGAQRRRRCGRRGPASGSSAPTGSASETCSLTLPSGSTCDDATPVLRRYASFSAGGRGERTLAHPRRIPLPQGGRGRDRARPQDRRPRRRSIPEARELTARLLCSARRCVLVTRRRLTCAIHV